MGLFDKDKKADFSDVQEGSSSSAPRHTDTGSTQHTYTVKDGDTLSAIAKREYGDANEWQRIFDANRDKVKDPDMIQPGQQLTIPARTEQGGFR